VRDVARARPFLTARWRHLAILNFEVDPAILAPRTPRGTELDAWRGRTYVSVVGFLFEDTRVRGWLVPFHRRFEEVNLRFYVRRRTEEGWRRGVVFVRELVPRAAVALVARALYNENYLCVPMGHDVVGSAAGASRVEAVAYRWTFAGRPGDLSVSVAEEPRPLAPGSEEEFITEHYWGYAGQRDGGTAEYRVDHPPWRVAPALRARLDCDAASLYGPSFAEALGAEPASAFLAEGSDVAVFRGARLPG
jgi:uncharacterized protein YqjF (DUF2071 family)